VKPELPCEIGIRLDSLLRETQNMLDETRVLLVSSSTQLERAQQALDRPLKTGYPTLSQTTVSRRGSPNLRTVSVAHC
jgi:hypothetical protein